MSELIILTLILFILTAIGGWINRHNKAANRLCKMFEGIIAKATENIAWALIGGK